MKKNTLKNLGLVLWYEKDVLIGAAALGALTGWLLERANKHGVAEGGVRMVLALDKQIPDLNLNERIEKHVKEHGKIQY